jgi:hypothetical protein
VAPGIFFIALEDLVAGVLDAVDFEDALAAAGAFEPVGLEGAPLGATAVAHWRRHKNQEDITNRG